VRDRQWDTMSHTHGWTFDWYQDRPPRVSVEATAHSAIALQTTDRRQTTYDDNMPTVSNGRHKNEKIPGEQAKHAEVLACYL